MAKKSGRTAWGSGDGALDVSEPGVDPFEFGFVGLKKKKKKNGRRSGANRRCIMPALVSAAKQAMTVGGDGRAGLDTRRSDRLMIKFAVR